MSHIDSEAIHAFQNRALDVQVDVTTEFDAEDLSSITFRVGAGLVTKTGLTATETATGVTIDVALSASDLDFTTGLYRWECYGTVNAQVRTLAHGWFTLEAEPTSEAESS